ncbi:hypothetical protein PV726_33160 [Streptomyces europaeiscabiei]|uniref:hypothetical protein n=1 Tax=Streptomyces europaeiscabiei TaxID=146819 RepID=UPI0029BB19F0|nr:hypothetical protein [Streptomyces europaeiscabiei]MDX3695105.1 hypothetical protein [Streptomyces europaeiscabiei]
MPTGTRAPCNCSPPRAAQGFTLLRHRGEALEVYLYDYHGEETSTQTALLMLAGAGRFAHADTETPVMYWGGDLYPDLPMNGDQPLAVMLVTATRARFVDTYPLDTLITVLRPVEADFLAATAYGDDENLGQDPPDLLDSALRAPSQ